MIKLFGHYYPTELALFIVGIFLIFVFTIPYIYSQNEKLSDYLSFLIAFLVILTIVLGVINTKYLILHKVDSSDIEEIQLVVSNCKIEKETFQFIKNNNIDVSSRIDFEVLKRFIDHKCDEKWLNNAIENFTSSLKKQTGFKIMQDAM